MQEKEILKTQEHFKILKTQEHFNCMIRFVIQRNRRAVHLSYDEIP